MDVTRTSSVLETQQIVSKMQALNSEVNKDQFKIIAKMPWVACICSMLLNVNM